MSERRVVKHNTVIILLVIAGASIAIHLLLRSNIPGSALLYVGIPFIISFILLTCTNEIENPTWKQKFINHIRNAFIIMMASSVILFEGFLCVVMFMPIYFGGVLFAFIIYPAVYPKNKNSLNMHIFPIIVLAISLEGTHPNLSFNRYNEVSSTKVVDTSITNIKKNLIKPVNLEDNRAWFLDLFPMPYQIENNILKPGAIHTIKYRYHRWFITNTHEGEALLRIDEVSDDVIKTKYIKDTSYISNYMKLHGTEIRFKALNEKSTEITLTIKYDRLLDPIWYFGPLQKYGVQKMGDYMISKMME